MQDTFELRNPFDNALIETLEYTSEAQAQDALKTAYKVHRDRNQWLSKSERIQILERLAALVEKQVEPLASQAAREGGKPLKDSIVELKRAVNGIRVAAREIEALNGTEIPMGLNDASSHRVAYTYLEPRGVVLAISAFNHPFNLVVHQVVTAIAAGCPVLVKPSLDTPLSCRSLVELLFEAGLPRQWCHLLFTTNDVTSKLVQDSRTAFLTFIGSAKVGWYLRSILAPGAHCALEHGGSAAVIVDKSADLELAIPALARGGFYHAGQVCVSVQRIFVHDAIAENFLKRFEEAAAKLVVGNPLDGATDVGPLIRPAEVERVNEWVKEAVEGGATVITGGAPIDANTYPPTILFNPPRDAKISKDEIFGPVVAIFPYKDFDDAMEQANDNDFFFQSAVFTRNLDQALSASRRLNAMAVMVNDHSAFRVDWMPFGGHRYSGLGMGGIRYSMRDMSIERTFVFQSSGLPE